MNRALPGEKENHLIGMDVAVVVVVVVVVLQQSYRCRRLRQPSGNMQMTTTAAKSLPFEAKNKENKVLILCDRHEAAQAVVAGCHMIINRVGEF